LIKNHVLYIYKKIKAQRLTWTQAWRRKNKKGKVETATKKKGKRTARVFKSIQGITVEDIKKRRDAKPDFRKAQRDAALREVKERNKKAKEDKKKVTKKAGKAAAEAIPRYGTLITPWSKQMKRGGFVEAKFFDGGATTSFTLSNAGTLVNLSSIAQGPGINQRVGDMVQLLGIDVRWHQTVGIVGDTFRLIVFSCNVDSSAVAVNSLLQNGDLGTVCAPSARYNYQSQRQQDLQVFHDSIHSLGILTTPAANNAKVYHIKLDEEIQFNTAAATGVGFVFAVLVGQTAGAGGAVILTTRLYYVDA